MAGLALALPAMRFLETLVPETMGAVHLALDWRVFVSSACVGVASALVFGLFPAMRASQLTPQVGLREGGRSGGLAPRSQRLQHSLVIVETALAVVLLTSTGLLLENLKHLYDTKLGLQSQRLLTFEVPLFSGIKTLKRRVIACQPTPCQSRPRNSRRRKRRCHFTNSYELQPTRRRSICLRARPETTSRDRVALTRVVSRSYFRNDRRPPA